MKQIRTLLPWRLDIMRFARNALITGLWSKPEHRLLDIMASLTVSALPAEL